MIYYSILALLLNQKTCDFLGYSHIVNFIIIMNIYFKTKIIIIN